MEMMNDTHIEEAALASSFEIFSHKQSPIFVVDVVVEDVSVVVFVVVFEDVSVVVDVVVFVEVEVADVMTSLSEVVAFATSLTSEDVSYIDVVVVVNVSVVVVVVVDGSVVVVAQVSG